MATEFDKNFRNEANTLLITKIALKFFWTFSVNFLSKIIFPEKYQFMRPIPPFFPPKS